MSVDGRNDAVDNLGGGAGEYKKKSRRQKRNYSDRSRGSSSHQNGCPMLKKRLKCRIRCELNGCAAVDV